VSGDQIGGRGDISIAGIATVARLARG
jgi:hypothetical protein